MGILCYICSVVNEQIRIEVTFRSADYSRTQWCRYINQYIHEFDYYYPFSSDVIEFCFDEKLICHFCFF